MAPKRFGSGNNSGGSDSSILAKISKSNIVSQGRRAACDVVYVSKKLLLSTGKAAWIFGTTAVIVGLPWIFATERERQLNEMDFEQASLLGVPPTGAIKYL